MKLYLLTLYILLTVALGENIFKPKILVILDNDAYQATHSMFFSDLKKLGFQLDFQAITNLKLKEYGEYIFDQIIMLSSRINIEKYGSYVKQIIDFFDSGRNVFIAADIDADKPTRQLFTQFGVEIDPVGSQLYDNFKTVDQYENAEVFTTNQLSQRGSFGAKVKYPVLYKGIGLSINKNENNNIYGILRGDNTTYSYSSEKQQIVSKGHNIVLVAAVQGKNNARAILTGSIEMLSNSFFKQNTNFSNREYIGNLVQWNFQLAGQLKYENVRHFLLSDGVSSEIYKPYDVIRYEIELYKWNWTTNQWENYVAPHDIDMEFYMLDPYIRMPLFQIPDTPKYIAEFIVPDKIGVFQFKVNYNRPGYTTIDVSTKVTIRPFKHDEYPRFLKVAYPYYGSVFATMAGLVIFSVYFLLHREKTSSTAKNTDQKEKND